MKKHITLAITCAGGTLIPAMTLHLKNSSMFDYRLIGLDSHSVGHSKAFLDAFAILPEGGSVEYAQKLLEYCREEKIDFILPGSDGEALALSHEIERFHREGIEILVSPPSVLKLIEDKAKTFSSLLSAGISVPQHTVVHNGEEALDAMKAYGYPAKSVVVKPCKGRGGRGMFVFCGDEGCDDWLGSGKRENRIEHPCLDAQALTQYIDSSGTLVMPVLKAPCYDIDVMPLAGGFFSIPRKRTNPTGIPFEGNVLVADQQLIDYGVRISSVLGIQSLHDIDLMTDSDGNAVVLEVNPRPSGSMTAALHAGFPLLDWLIADRLGIEVKARPLAHDIEMKPSVQSIIIPVSSLD